MDTCPAVVSEITRHAQTVQSRPSADALVVISTPESGIGDQISAFLSALTVAVATGRRLEILPDGVSGVTSYIAAGFNLPFDVRYTGGANWVVDARTWYKTEYPRLKPNASSILQNLVRVEREAWGLTVTTSQPALTGRLIVPSPSGLYPPMHPKVTHVHTPTCAYPCIQVQVQVQVQVGTYMCIDMHHQVLRRRHEFLLGGNVGASVFRTYFERHLRARGIGYSPQAVSCMLKQTLRPSDAVLALVAAMRPPTLLQRPPTLSWKFEAEQLRRSHHSLPGGGGGGGVVVVGVHIRSEAHLLNRAAHTEDARYLSRAGASAASAFAADVVFAGCAAAALVSQSVGGGAGKQVASCGHGRCQRCRCCTGAPSHTRWPTSRSTHMHACMHAGAPSSHACQLFGVLASGFCHRSSRCLYGGCND